nr:flavodoxin family protein [Desulfobulbus alkaliphilus]
MIFNGSPRKGGNTELLLTSVAAGIEQSGFRAEYIRLADLAIHPCIGCGHCEREGHCIFADDMTALYAAIEAAHRIVLASPIYFYGVTAQTKIFIDRCQVLWSRKYLLSERKAYRDDLRGYMVSVAATAGEKIFAGARLTIRYALDAMDCPLSGELLVKEVSDKGAVAGKPEIMAEALQLGNEICRPD